MSKGAELSYKLGYLLTLSLILPVRPVHLYCKDLSVTINGVYSNRPHYELPS